MPTFLVMIVDAIVKFESVVREEKRLKERGDDLNGDDSGIAVKWWMLWTITRITRRLFH